jgi:hypothetical protein
MFDRHLRTKKTPPKTNPTLDFERWIADNIGMENIIYSVELHEHHVGLQEYHLFSSEQKAEDFADGFMTQREEWLGRKYETADVRFYEKDVVRVWERSGEDVIIRKKDLLG